MMKTFLQRNVYLVDLDAIGMAGEHEAFGVADGEPVPVDLDWLMDGLERLYGKEDKMSGYVFIAFFGIAPCDKGVDMAAGDIPGPNVTHACKMHDVAYERLENASDPVTSLYLTYARMVLATLLIKAGLKFVPVDELVQCEY